ncbi:MAG: Panacea domain-containing protein [Streptosporangiaceae bacterium]
MGAPPYSALTIAKWFIAWAEAESDELSNMKLQKLLYYAQGHHLAFTGMPLFTEVIQAWSHGPVIPEIYHAFKKFDAKSITLSDRDPFTFDEVNRGTSEFLVKIWNTYGGYSAGRLRNMTHQEHPWRDNWGGESDRGRVISHADMSKFFEQFKTA